MGKRCPEDFNPWPPFVDIFASVILVLMLFLLITIVNIGYYAQFKSVKSYTSYATVKVDTVIVDDGPPAPTTCIPRPEVKEQKDEIDMISFHKVPEPQSTESNSSLFSGGIAEGNAVMYAREKERKITNQTAVLKERSIELFFEDKEIFINTAIKFKIKKFIGDINRMTKESKFTIFVRDPDGIISATLAKQISLGRVLNIKSIIKKSNIKSKRIKINLQEQVSVPSKYGSLVIKAYIP